MRRDTACFSMYSDMSMRTMWVSSSNRNSASERASSVLPDAGRAQEDERADGRFGSCSPARARRTAFATAATASSWPITRACRRSSMCSRRSCSPSSILSTGMPVHFDTTAAMSSSVTSSRRNDPCFCASFSSAAFGGAAFSSSGIAAEAQLRGAVQVALALRQLRLGLARPRPPP